MRGQQIAAAWKRYNHVDNKPWFPREQDAAAVVSRTSSFATTPTDHWRVGRRRDRWKW